MSLNSRSKLDIKEIVLLSLLGAVLFVIQVLLKSIPNVELVSLFIFVYAFIYGKKALYSVYIFVVLEGLIYGFAIWWIGYIYVWLPLVFIPLIFKKMNKKIGSITVAIILGIYGLVFGFLFAIMYAIIDGINFGVSYWISGLVYDLIHCASNAIIGLILFKPLSSLLSKLNTFYTK